jgi:hypothetical protein
MFFSLSFIAEGAEGSFSMMYYATPRDKQSVATGDECSPLRSTLGMNTVKSRPWGPTSTLG